MGSMNRAARRKSEKSQPTLTQPVVTKLLTEEVNHARKDTMIEATRLLTVVFVQVLHYNNGMGKKRLLDVLVEADKLIQGILGEAITVEELLKDCRSFGVDLGENT